MDVRNALIGQYHVSLKMLREAIEQCPDGLWAGGDYEIAFWRVAYHALFFADLYLQKDEKSFRPWEHHREEYQFLGKLPWPPHREPKIGEPYTKEEVLTYWEMVHGMVEARVKEMDLEAAECGFWWYKLGKLEHQINNIRHIQHHAALLSGRLRKEAGIDFAWVGFC